MNNIAIRADNLTKIYSIGSKNERYKALRDTLTDAASAPLRRVRSILSRSGANNRKTKETIYALKELSFELKCGEVMGVIGRNGAGKSTLLKVLSRITEPSAGYADINGRVGSLLEVGTGFHPELTGAENIFLSGAILGMRRAEIKRKFDEIVDFAEVTKFIDTPVKHYSSGMYLRLAFAVAAHLEPEILMVDEVLAVGDLAFQRKCIGKMQEVGESGQTVIFVSHDMTAISRLATVSLVLQDGACCFYGPTSDAIDFYCSNQQVQDGGDLATRKDRKGDGVIRITSLTFYDSRGKVVANVGSGDAVTVALGYTSNVKNLRYEDIALDMLFLDVMGHPITTFSTRFSQKAKGALSREGVLICHIPELALAEESYAVTLWLAYRGGLADAVLRAGELRVITNNYYGTGQEPVKRKHGAGLIRHEWTVDAAVMEEAS